MSAIIGNGIQLGNPLDVNANVPSDSRNTQPNIAARNAIVWKYDGLECYVESEKLSYVFILGRSSNSLLDNGNWAPVGEIEPDIVGPGTYTKVTVNSKGKVTAGDYITTNDVGGLIDVGTGRINQSLMPAISIVDTFVRSSEAAMLALDAQQGDICIRTDLNKSFILTNDDPTNAANWQELINISGTVTSVSLTMPNEEFIVSNPTITSSGTFGVTWKPQTPRKVFASPTLSTGVPTFRGLEFADIPGLQSAIDSKEVLSNKAPNLISPDSIKYPSTLAVANALSGKANLTGDNTFNGNNTFNGLTTFSSGEPGIYSEISIGNTNIQDNSSTGFVNVGLPMTSGQLALTSDIPTSLSGFTNDLGNYGNWITQAQGNGYYMRSRVQSPGSGLNANSLYDGSSSITVINGASYPDTYTNFPYVNSYGAIATFEGLYESGLSFQLYANSVVYGGANPNELWFRSGTNTWKRVVSSDEIQTNNGSTLNNNISGYSAASTRLSSYNGANNIYWGWGGSMFTAKVDNADFGNTIPINIGGNAPKWGNITSFADGSVIGSDLAYILGTHANGFAYRFNQTATRNWLGLPTSGAYDLQWVTSNGNKTNVPIVFSQLKAVSAEYSTDTARIVLGNDEYISWVNPNGTGTDIAIKVNNSNKLEIYAGGANRLIVDTNGNVGIGVTNPLSKFHVAGSAQIDTDITLGFNGQTNRIASREVNQTLVLAGSGDLRFQTYSGGWFDRLVIANNGSAEFKNNVNFATDIGVAGKLYAARTGGDGTSWGSAQLEVQGTNPGIGFHYPGVYGASLYMNNNGQLNWGGNGFFTNSSISAGSWIYTPSTIDAGDFVRGQRIIAGYDSGFAGSINTNNYFRLSGGGGITWDSYGTTISSTANNFFHVQSNFTDGNFILRTTAGSSGHLHWNNSNELGFLNSSGSWSLRVNHVGDVYVTGYLTATGGAGTSDIRHKTLVDFKEDLSWLDKDRTIAFKWKDTNIDNKTHYGYSAQEINDFIPDLVFKDNEEKWALNQVELLTLEVKRLKQRVSQLEGK